MTTNQRRVLVTPRSMSGGESAAVRRLGEAGFDVILPTPGRQPRPEELRAALPGVIGWIAGVEPITADVLEAATELRVISRNGAGNDAIDLHAANARGVAVVTARGSNARGVAELALTLAFMGLRSLLPASRSVASGGWDRATGREAYGRTIGIVGYGAIGRTLGEVARAVGMTVIAHDPYVSFVDETDVRSVGLDELLRRSDVVSLHVPGRDGHPLIGADQLAKMTAGSVLVNTARSNLVDDQAVLDALKDGHLGTYAVDAFETEPPTMTELIRHPRIIATPHLGAATWESIERASQAAVTNLIDALDMESPQFD
jgi:D-3-phosphoglycerate dehydrogenase